MNHPPVIELSVVTCMYNEALIVRQKIDNLLSFLNTLSCTWELILVNDGSTDETHQIVKDKTKDNQRVHIVSYTQNRGRGFALRQGFLNSKGAYVVSIESDLNYGQDIIPALMKALIESQSDIVVASPYMPGGKVENVPPMRAFLSRAGNYVLRWSMATTIHTFTGMTRGYKGDFIRGLPLEEDGKEVHLEILSKASMLKARVTEIPALLKWPGVKKKGPTRKSKFSAKKIIKSHLLFSFSESPIMLFGSIGGIILLSGLFLGLYLAFVHFILNETIGDKIILIMTTVFLILLGMSLFLFCFIAYQIKDLRRDIFQVYYKLNQPQQGSKE